MLKAPMMLWLLALLLVAMATRTAELFDEQRNVVGWLVAMSAGWLEKKRNIHGVTPSLEHPTRRVLDVLHIESALKPRAQARRRTARGPPGPPARTSVDEKTTNDEEKTC
jgi:hypothetical protein